MKHKLTPSILTIILLFYFPTAFNLLTVTGAANQKISIQDPNYFVKTLNEDEFTIAEIAPFSSCDDVLKFLGKPQKIRQDKEQAINNSDYLQYKDTWIYAGIEIEFSTSVEKGAPAPVKPDRVFGVVVTGSKYATSRGVQVGDPVGKVLQKYGVREPVSNRYTYEVDLMYIEFVITKDKVSKIIIGGYPD